MMNKIYNSFSILYCLLLTTVGLLLMIFPFYGSIIGVPFTEAKILFAFTSLTIIGLLALTPPPIALIGFYLSGGIGKKWFSHILATINVLLVLLIGLAILYVAFVYLISGPDKIGYITSQALSNNSIPSLILATSSFFILPISHTFVALIVQNVSVFKRLLPFISLVLSIILVIIFGAILFAISAIAEIESINIGLKDTTVIHLLLLSSIAWSLVSFIAFFSKSKNKRKDTSSAAASCRSGR